MDRTIVPVTSANYIECVKATEPTDYGVVADRLASGMNTEALLIAMSLSVHVGYLMDAVKKQLFYGRAYPPDAVTMLAKYANLMQVAMPKEPLRPMPVRVLRLLHCVLGLVSESAEELTSAVMRRIFADEPIDWVNINEELGDIEWYTGVGIDVSEHTMDQCLTTNIRKLAKRYPKKFEAMKALIRDIDAEREVLESNTVTGDVNA